MLAGCAFTAYLISSISSFMSSRGVTFKMFLDEMALLKNYFNSRKVDVKVKDNICLYFDYLYSRQCGLTAERIFASLPAAIVREIKLSMSLEQLRTIPFFSSQTEAFLSQCVASLDFLTCSPGTKLFTAGSLPSLPTCYTASLPHVLI
jgi:hypothetical protein